MTRKHLPAKRHPTKPGFLQNTRRTKRKSNWLWMGLGSLLVALIVIFVVNQHNSLNSAAKPANPTDPPVLTILPAEAYAKYQQGAFFLDVRSQDEWDQFHVRGSTLIPLDQLQNRTGELPKDQDIVVVCLTGHRSQNGAVILVQAGFKQVFCLSGGLDAWIAAGYPVEKYIP